MIETFDHTLSFGEPGGLFEVGSGDAILFTYSEDNANSVGVYLFEDSFPPQTALGAPSLLNRGEISYVTTAETWVYLIRGTSQSFFDGAEVKNSGVLRVETPGEAFAVYFDSHAPDIVNTGDIVVRSTGGQAIAVFNWDPTDGFVSNSGLIEAEGASTTMGVYLPNGGEVINAGSILATTHGETDATGISYGGRGLGTIVNTGTIVAAYQGPSSTLGFDSQGIAYFGSASEDDPFEIINHGSITATYAIWQNFLEGQDTGATRIENYGVLDGHVVVGEVKDVVINAGLIDGVVDLWSGDDLYDGSEGSVTAVYGWKGADVLLGGDADDTFFGEQDDDVLEGGRGVNYLDGGEGGDTASYAHAAAGVVVSLQIVDFQFTVGAGLDLLVGIENLQGSQHGDDLRGNAAANTIAGGAGFDRIAGGGGADVLSGGGGFDTIDGGAGQDVISGGAGKDTIDGRGGADVVAGGNYDDTLNGNAGADTLSGDKGDDVASGGGGADTLIGGNGDDVLNGAAGDDRLYGNNGADRLGGGADDDVLNGGGNADTLNGGAGDDRLRGDKGPDALTGGAGADTFIYLSPSDAGAGAGFRDQILDFSRAEGDLIDLSAIDADATADGGQAFTVVGALSGAAGQLAVSSLGGGVVLVAIDVDGDGSADMAIEVTGQTDLAAGDFVL